MAAHISTTLYILLLLKQQRQHLTRQMAQLKASLTAIKENQATFDKALIVQKTTLEKQHSDLLAVKGSMTIGRTK